MECTNRVTESDINTNISHPYCYNKQDNIFSMSMYKAILQYHKQYSTIDTFSMECS